MSVVDVANVINYITSATYAPHGEIASFTRGSIFGAFSYNSRLQPLQIFYGTNSPPALTGTTCPLTVGNIMHRVYNFGLGTNDNGNVFSIANCRDANRTQNFDYDNLNRIAHAYTSGPNWGDTFTTDAWGNLTNIGSYTGKTNHENLNAAPANVKNQLNGFCHDSVGNLVLNSACPAGSFTPTYSYDIENRLTSAAAGYTYVYDGDGQRAKKCTNSGCTTGTLYWRNTAGDPLLEAGVGGTDHEEYVFFNGKRIARRDVSANTVHYYFADHLRSADVVSSAAGVIEDESDYYPYGGEIAITNSDPNNYKFTGKERDTESGLDYFGARYYGSIVGRFSSTDPKMITRKRMIDPQQWNGYQYARNSPLKYVDPTGNETRLASGMNAADSQATMVLLATQYQKETQRSIIAAAATTAIHNDFGVSHIGVPCNGSGNACGGTGGENEVHHPNKNGKPDASDPSKIRNVVTVDLTANEQTHTDPNSTMKHELEHTAQINTDPQGALDSIVVHQNDNEPTQTNPLEVLALTAQNAPDEPNTLGFDQAMTDVEILLNEPHDPISFSGEVEGAPKD